jgi:diadenosine tetraphosphate (Ap4A) HIT family hydrolase
VTHLAGCPLCEGPGGLLVYSGAKLRVIRANEAGFPAFYRVIWNDHVAEFTDLASHDRAECMEAVARVESVLREKLRPDKINLAALGNVVPHLHWHVIARFAWDSHFPSPVWAESRHAPDSSRVAELEQRLPEVEEALREALGAALRAALRAELPGISPNRAAP